MGGRVFEGQLLRQVVKIITLMDEKKNDLKIIASLSLVHFRGLRWGINFALS